MNPASWVYVIDFRDSLGIFHVYQSTGYSTYWDADAAFFDMRMALIYSGGSLVMLSSCITKNEEVRT